MSQKEIPNSFYNSPSMEHNSNIDVLRIIACLQVILIHVMIGDLYENNLINKQALLIHCIVSDAVAIFFSITGFLWFRYDKPTKKVFLNFFYKIAIPTICAAITSQILFKWLNSGSWYLSMDMISAPNIGAIIKGILQHNAGIWNNLSNVYWYILDYALICLWFPVIKAIVANKNGQLIIFSIIGWTILNLLIRNLIALGEVVGFHFSLYTYTPIPIQIIMVLLGYLMFKQIQNITSHCTVFMSIGIYILLITIRFYLQSILYNYDLSTQTSHLNKCLCTLKIQ